MHLVQESLDSYYIEILLNNINEGRFDMAQIKSTLNKIKKPKEAFNQLLQKFNTTSDKSKREKLATILAFIFITYGSVVGLKNRITPPQMDTILKELVLSTDQVSPQTFKSIIIKNKKEKESQPIIDQISIANNPAVLDELNDINPGRFDKKYIESRYDKYDEQIAEAVKELRGVGEKPNPIMIKGLMMVETGMRARKNSKGYEGFAQTTQGELDWVNDKYGMHFTIKNMYDAKEAAKFIHYYLKLLYNLKHVTSEGEALAAYNFGYGNLKKVKSGEISEYPQETKDYVKLISTLVRA